MVVNFLIPWLFNQNMNFYFSEEAIFFLIMFLLQDNNS